MLGDLGQARYHQNSRLQLTDEVEPEGFFVFLEPSEQLNTDDVFHTHDLLFAHAAVENHALDDVVVED